MTDLYIGIYFEGEITRLIHDRQINTISKIKFSCTNNVSQIYIIHCCVYMISVCIPKILAVYRKNSKYWD